MREHIGLYRGKRLSNGKWMQGNLLQYSDGTCCICHAGSRVNHYKVDPTTIGECTSLRDKNGKLIFEGDILKWDEREWGCPYSEVAEWKYPLLAARKNDWKEWCEIIGNIHDNKELLNENKV